MAKAFCIPKNIAEQLKDSVRNGEWNMQTLWDMTSKQRHELFMKYVDDATALRMNAGFEQAMISEQQNALVKWAEKVFVGQDEKTKSSKKDVIDKIKELNEVGYIKTTVGKNGELEMDEQTEIFLSDMVEESLGVSITEQEMKTITEKVRVLEQYENERDDYGLPINEYWEARRDIENYVKSLVPSKNLKVATSLIGRGTMLFSVKSPLLNIESNTLFAAIQKMEKRIARLLTGRNVSAPKEVNNYMSGYRKRVLEIMNKYNYDVTRIFDLKSEMKTLGEEKQVHAQGKGAVRKIGRFYEDIVFSKLLSLPDVFYSAYAFSDSAGLWATEIAKSEGLSGAALDARALAITKDSTKIQPETLDGKKVRELAILDAQHATYTDDTIYSKVGLGIRGILNTASGNLRIGDLLIPFVKTPANVVGAGLEMGGVGLVQGVLMLPDAIKDIKTGDSRKMDMAIRKMVATGLGWTLAYILSAIFEPEDFIGAYPTSAKERQLMNEKGAMPNSIKIGDKWISIDYFGAIGTPLLGFMYARKYKGGDPVGLIFEYLNGSKVALTNFPALEEFATIATDLSGGAEIKYDPEQFKKNLVSESIDFIRARTIPALVSDFAKMTDKFERDTYAKSDPLAKLKASIPFVRQSLPVKKNVFGEELKTEAAWSVLLFGSRLKTAKRGEFIDEIVRLDQTGNAPSITNSEWTSPRVESMKEWLSEEDYKAMISLYQKEWVEESLDLINSSKYQKLKDDEKASELTKIKTAALDKALKKYKYKTLKKRDGQ